MLVCAVFCVFNVDVYVFVEIGNARIGFSVVGYIKSMLSLGVENLINVHCIPICHRLWFIELLTIQWLASIVIIFAYKINTQWAQTLLKNIYIRKIIKKSNYIENYLNGTSSKFY